MPTAIPGAIKRNVYLFYDNSTEKRDTELAEIRWVREKIWEEEDARIADDEQLQANIDAEENRAELAESALQTAITNETARAERVEATKEILSNKVTTTGTYAKDDWHYPSTALMEAKIAELSPKQIEWATYGTTTADQINSWAMEGKLVVCQRAQRFYVLQWRNGSGGAAFYNVERSPLFGVEGFKANFLVVDGSGGWSEITRTINPQLSTSSWDSSDNKYPTTAAVDARITDTAVVFDIEAHDYQCRVWHTNSNNVTGNTSVSFASSFPWVADLVTNGLIANTAATRINFKNLPTDTLYGFDVSRIRGSNYFLKNPTFIIKGLAKKYYSNITNTGMKILSAAAADNVFLTGSQNVQGTSTNGSEFPSSTWYRLPTSSSDTGTRYELVANPLYLGDTSYSSGSYYEAAWYSTSGGSLLGPVKLLDGTDDSTSSLYNLYKCFALRKFSVSGTFSNEIVIEQKMILISQAASTGANPWDNCIVDGYLDCAAYYPAGKYSYGAVIAKRGIDNIATNGYNWDGLLVTQSIGYSTSTALVSSWDTVGLKLVDDVSHVNTPGHRLAFGKSCSIISDYDTLEYGDMNFTWVPGASWRRWARENIGAGNGNYPWGDILTSPTGVMDSGARSTSPWHQYGNLSEYSLRPGGYWKPQDITASCWSLDPGWYTFDTTQDFCVTGGPGSNNEVSINATAFWHTLVWSVPSVSWDVYAKTDPRYMGKVGQIRFTDMSTVYGFRRPTDAQASGDPTAVYVYRDFYANATTSQKDTFKFVVNDVAYYMYPAIQVSFWNIKPVIILHADNDTWNTSAKTPSADYPWSNYIFDSGYLTANYLSTNVHGLIQSNTSYNTDIPFGDIWILWGSGSAMLTKMFTNPMKINSMDTTRSNAIGNQVKSTGDYTTPGVYANYSAHFVEAAIPKFKSQIANTYAFNLPAVWSNDLIDLQTQTSTTGFDEFLGMPNHINYLTEKASSYYLDNSNDELVVNEWDFSNGGATQFGYPTKTTRRIALGPSANDPFYLAKSSWSAADHQAIIDAFMSGRPTVIKYASNPPATVTYATATTWTAVNIAYDEANTRLAFYIYHWNGQSFSHPPTKYLS